MKKFSLVFLLLVNAFILTAQTLQSPEQFLGYKIGIRFTPHYKIVNYFNAIAQAKPLMVKVEKYGETYEGRDLILTYVASPENMQRLDVIRLNNLRLAGMTKDKMAPVVDGAPAIVWLSYNVHGNEPSSSEAAMMVLYALVDPNNTQTKEWLKNTVVIIDPCINPDGRDRYVNWYNTSSGAMPNAYPDAREHGWSNGGMFVYNVLWAARGSKFAALCPAASLLSKASGKITIPVMHVGGTSDPVVDFTYQQKTVQTVRNLDLCSDNGTTWATGENGVLGTHYPSSISDPVLFLKYDGGHDYPSNIPPLIVKFFKQVAAGTIQ